MEQMAPADETLITIQPNGIITVGVKGLKQYKRKKLELDTGHDDYIPNAIELSRYARTILLAVGTTYTWALNEAALKDRTATYVEIFGRPYNMLQGSPIVCSVLYTLNEKVAGYAFFRSDKNLPDSTKPLNTFVYLMETHQYHYQLRGGRARLAKLLG